MNPKRNRRGFIFIYAYLLIVLFMVYELALLTYFAQNINAFERFSNNTIAYQLAEAGLDSAMAQLKNNQIVFDANGNYTETRDFILGNYNVTVSNQQEDLDGDGASDGPLAPNTFRITTLASAPAVANPARPIQQATNVVAYVRREENPLFEDAIFSHFEIEITDFVDSYDSRNGPYDSTTAGSNGNIRTNFTGDNAINVSPGALVQGNAVIGPRGNPDEAISLSRHGETNTDTPVPPEIITGTQTAAASNRIAEVISSTAHGANECGTFMQGTLWVVGGDCTLEAGDYHVNKVHIANTTIRTNGPVKLFVEENVAMINSVINPSGRPSDFLLYAGTERSHHAGSGGLGSFVKMDKSTFSGGIYAPRHMFWLTRSELFGGVVGSSYQKWNSAIWYGEEYKNKIHYDEALRNVGGGGQGAKMNLVSWRTVPIESNSADSE